MKLPHQRPVTVEDLLRLKRAERPPEAFWADFDRGLRAKQLAALLPRRPWWQRWAESRFWPAWGRLALPLGAAGLIAGIFLLPRPVGETVGPPEGVAWIGEPDPVAGFVAPEAESSAPAAFAAARDLVPVAAETEPLVVAAADVVPTASPVREPAPARVATPSFPVTWDLAGGSEPAMAVSLLGGARRFEARAGNPRPVVEPLQQMVPPGDRRGARILTAMVSVSSTENGPRATDRVASRLSEERLYDQIERFGARGAGVKVRF